MSSNRINRRKTKNEENAEVKGDGYKSLTLKDIRDCIGELCLRFPKDDNLDPNDQDAVKAWASDIQTIVDEFNLLLSCVGVAIYKWGSDRSGAADQNINLLAVEMGTSRGHIQASVSTRLSSILAPEVQLVVDKVVTTKQVDGTEIRQNVYCHKRADPGLEQMEVIMLCRIAKHLRQLCLENFHKSHKCIGDFLEAQQKDSQHDSRGFAM